MLDIYICIVITVAYNHMIAYFTGKIFYILCQQCKKLARAVWNYYSYHPGNFYPEAAG